MSETAGEEIGVAEVLEARLSTYSLTQREREIVLLVLEGLSNKEIARSCSITEQTVKDHLKHVFSKIGVHQRALLISTLLGFSPAITRSGKTFQRTDHGLPAHLSR